MTVKVIDVGTGLVLASAGTAELAKATEPIEAAEVPGPSEQALLGQVLGVIDLRGTELSVDAGHARRRIPDLVDAVGGAATRDRAYWMLCIEGNQHATRKLIRQAFGRGAEHSVDTYTERVGGRSDVRTTRVVCIEPCFAADAALRAR